MATLQGLKDAPKKEMDFELLTGKAGQLKRILDEGKAGTNAGHLGAINVWRTTHGFISVEYMMYMRTLDSRSYKTIAGAEKWIKKYLKRINA